MRVQARKASSTESDVVETTESSAPRSERTEARDGSRSSPNSYYLRDSFERAPSDRDALRQQSRLRALLGEPLAPARDKQSKPTEPTVTFAGVSTQVARQGSAPTCNSASIFTGVLAAVEAAHGRNEYDFVINVSGRHMNERDSRLAVRIDQHPMPGSSDAGQRFTHALARGGLQ